MATHRFKTLVDLAILARFDLVGSRLHVVVNTPLRDAAQGGKGAGVGNRQQSHGSVSGLARGTNKVHHPAVATFVPLGFDLVKQGSRGSP